MSDSSAVSEPRPDATSCSSAAVRSPRPSCGSCSPPARDVRVVAPDVARRHRRRAPACDVTIARRAVRAGRSRRRLARRRGGDAGGEPRRSPRRRRRGASSSTRSTIRPTPAAFLSGVVRRDGVTLAISTSGDAPALTALLREALDALLPRDLGDVDAAGARGSASAGGATACRWTTRKPRLLEALNALYRQTADAPSIASIRRAASAAAVAAASAVADAPEDSWL